MAWWQRMFGLPEWPPEKPKYWPVEKLRRPADDSGAMFIAVDIDRPYDNEPSNFS